MKFVDETRIEVIAGKGGDGLASLRREKFIPKGGPSGGDGGRGGSIYLIVDQNLNTLIDYRYARIHRAKNGENGRSKDRYGRGSDDLFLRVPIGTIVRDFHTHKIIGDLNQADSRLLVAKGGEGGLGNIHFKSSINQAPRQFTRGTLGEQRELLLELQLLADVGLIGLPNAGKSTLLASISAARPKIADYPFTTLFPNLGMVQLTRATAKNASPFVDFVVADIPGLIQGAAHGVGLGHQFLRHIRRTQLLLHIIDISPLRLEEGGEQQVIDQAITIRKELQEYDRNLLKKPIWCVLNKIDLWPADTYRPQTDALIKKLKRVIKANEWLTVSAIEKKGCEAMCYQIGEALAMMKPIISSNVNDTDEPHTKTPQSNITPTPLPSSSSLGKKPQQNLDIFQGDVSMFK